MRLRVGSAALSTSFRCLLRRDETSSAVLRRQMADAGADLPAELATWIALVRRHVRAPVWHRRPCSRLRSPKCGAPRPRGGLAQAGKRPYTASKGGGADILRPVGVRGRASKPQAARRVSLRLCPSGPGMLGHYAREVGMFDAGSRSATRGVRTAVGIQSLGQSSRGPGSLVSREPSP